MAIELALHPFHAEVDKIAAVEERPRTDDEMSELTSRYFVTRSVDIYTVNAGPRCSPCC